MLQVFKKYLLFKKDHSELLFYILRQLAMDQVTFLRGRGSLEHMIIEINEKDLLDKVFIKNLICTFLMFLKQHFSN